MIFPPINKVPFTTLHELNLDWVLNELVTRFNDLVDRFNELVTAFNKLADRQDELEAKWEELQPLVDELKELLDKLPEEKIDELLALADTLAKETADRTAEDAKLQQEIADLTNTTSADITALGVRITSETTARKEADETLNVKIENVQTDLQEKLDNEIESRRSEDTLLDNKITTANNALADEIAARKAGDTALDGKIAAETTARTSADTNLQSQIDAIVTSAGGASADITQLRKDLTSLTGTVNTNQAAVDASQALQDQKIDTNINNINLLQNSQADQAIRLGNIEQRQNLQDNIITEHATLLQQHESKLTGLISSSGAKLVTAYTPFHYEGNLYDIDGNILFADCVIEGGSNTLTLRNSSNIVLNTISSSYFFRIDTQVAASIENQNKYAKAFKVFNDFGFILNRPTSATLKNDSIITWSFYVVPELSAELSIGPCLLTLLYNSSGQIRCTGNYYDFTIARSEMLRVKLQGSGTITSASRAAEKEVIVLEEPVDFLLAKKE